MLVFKNIYSTPVSSSLKRLSLLKVSCLTSKSLRRRVTVLDDKFYFQVAVSRQSNTLKLELCLFESHYTQSVPKKSLIKYSYLLKSKNQK